MSGTSGTAGIEGSAGSDGSVVVDDLALVLVRAPSPFLSNAALARREAACRTTAGALASRVEVISRVVAGSGGPVAELRRRAVEGRASVLVTWSVQGLVTSPVELANLSELIHGGASLFEARTGRPAAVTTQRLADTLPARPSSSVVESRRHAALTRAGREAVAQDGGWLGGRCPLGWVVDDRGEVTLDLRAAGFIRAATARVAAGAKVGLIAAQWNAAQFTTVTGNAWTFGSTRRVLLRARNAGLAEYRGRIVGRSSWPAIVSVPEWTQARRMLTARARRDIA